MGVRDVRGPVLYRNLRRLLKCPLSASDEVLHRVKALMLRP